MADIKRKILKTRPTQTRTRFEVTEPCAFEILCSPIHGKGGVKLVIEAPLAVAIVHPVIRTEPDSNNGRHDGIDASARNAPDDARPIT